jgi:hypothetical protein
MECAPVITRTYTSVESTPTYHPPSTDDYIHKNNAQKEREQDEAAGENGRRNKKDRRVEGRDGRKWRREGKK